MERETKHKGFTLVELAIVLIIIGIILGAVLKGQEIINNAKIKRLLNDYKGYMAAIYTYQERYGVLPGDDRYAHSRFPNCVPRPNNGDGDGRMDDEGGKVWHDLRCAGIIPGSGTATPTHVFGGNVVIRFDRYNIPGHSVCFQNVPGDIAEIVDRKDDDGKPNSGSIQGSGTATSYDPTIRYEICFRL